MLRSLRHVWHVAVGINRVIALPVRQSVSIKLKSVKSREQNLSDKENWHSAGKFAASFVRVPTLKEEMQLVIRTVLCCLLCGFQWGAISLFAGESPSASTIAEWIDQLYSEERATRLHAAEQLQNAGRASLPQLKQALQRDRSGQGIRIEQLIRSIQIDAAQRALNGSPVSCSKCLFTEAVQAISEQSGTPVDLELPMDAAVRREMVSISKLPFWSALEKLCAAGQLGWHWDDHDRIVLDEKTARLPGGFTVSKAFRLNAEFALRESVGPGVPATIRVKLRVDAEADVLPRYVMLRDQKIQLSGNGQAFAPFTPDAKREVDFSRQTAEVSLDFIVPPGAAAPPDSLRGTLQLQCAAMVQQFHFPLTDVPSPMSYAGQNEVRLLQVKQDGAVLNVILQVVYPPDLRWESYRLQGLHRAGRLERSMKDPLPFAGLDVFHGATHRHEVHYRFERVNEPLAELKLFYAIPALETVLELPFEIDLAPTVAVGNRE